MLRISRTERRAARVSGTGYRATMGVAASVAVLAVFGTLAGAGVVAGRQTPSRRCTATRCCAAKWTSSRTTSAPSRSIRASLPLSAEAPAVNNGKFSGTGFALTADGYLVTSYHVIQGADSLLIEGRDRQHYHAETVYSDVAHDLAILRITDKKFTGFGRLPYTFKAGQADLGERVFTLGYPREDVVYGEGALSARSGFGRRHGLLPGQHSGEPRQLGRARCSTSAAT
ncbi:MAG: serine protease [Hymenobacter sp.]